MKKVLAITCLLVLAASSMALAAEPHWRDFLGADDNAGGFPGPVMTIGAQPGQADGYSTSDLEAAYGSDISNSTAWAVGVFVDYRDGINKTWTKDVKSDLEPVGYVPPKKVWDVRVAALPAAQYPRIGLKFTTVGTTTLPPSTLPLTGPVNYTLILTWRPLEDVDTPPVGTKWLIPIPAAHPSTFWDIKVNADTTGHVWAQGLKTVKVQPNHPAMIAGGYQFLFIQEAVPEPSALLAFGSGIVGLVGLAVRRRRA